MTTEALASAEREYERKRDAYRETLRTKDMLARRIATAAYHEAADRFEAALDAHAAAISP